ncbi:MAG: hypothetical protein EXR28_15980 [Betaproteobacteria bacterium]|nr:hypothetical protein [Betaproteobacteria bacterium]
MRILFDQGVPAPLRKFLVGHHVDTAYERGWDTKQNGDLLDSAQSEYDLFITTDKNLRYQQNLSARTIAIAILSTTQWPVIREQIDSVAAQIGAVEPGSFVEIRVD